MFMLTSHTMLSLLVIVTLNVLFCLSQLIYVNFVFVYCTDLLVVVLKILNSLHYVLCNLDVSLFSHFILVGDFNVDFLSPNRHLYHKLLSITSCFLLQQVVTEPTHFSHLGTPSIIDLFFVSNPTHLISCSTVFPLSTSDHLGILLTYKLPTTNKRPAPAEEQYGATPKVIMRKLVNCSTELIGTN